MVRQSKRTNQLLCPELIADVEGPWEVFQTVLDDAKISKEVRQAYVPPAYTEAQQLARMHEEMHARESPKNWLEVRTRILSMGDTERINLDSDAVLKIAKMVEENRIDWLLWTDVKDFISGKQIRIDMRPCRQVLKWEAIPIPDDNKLEALCQTLQLAWTVWGHIGMWHGEIENYPEEVDTPLKEGVQEYFKATTKALNDMDADLYKAMLKALVLIYSDPTHETRDDVTFELAKYFLKEEEFEQPPPDDEEEALQEAAEEEERAEEESKRADRQDGGHNAVETYGHWQLHDHTRGRRRPHVRIRRKNSPVDTGTVVRYIHRWALDRTIFGRKSKQTGSLMIDMSGSMQWTNDDMMMVLDHMPNIVICGYSGHTVPDQPQVKGRICIFAKNGVFNEFTGLDPTHNGGNDIDEEALAYLGKLPEPRFWLSDGVVCGGIHYGELHPHFPKWNWGYGASFGRTIFECHRLQKKYGILRVDTKDDLIALMKRRRIVVYKSPVISEPQLRKLHSEVVKSRSLGAAGMPWKHETFYPKELPREPMPYQL